ncbi:MAG: hypothetical protein JW726_14875 [Anaerolineales bacterium]|nr:hypothetical protein [Anaerolineales bacterium]
MQFVCDTFDRILTFYSPNWSWLAENIAAGYTTPSQVMTGWMNSTGHRNNILSAFGSGCVGINAGEGALPAL